MGHAQATRTSTERFWAAQTMADDDARVLRDGLDRPSRSRMQRRLVRMVRHGLVHDADLEAFSPALRAWIRATVREGAR